MECWFLKRGEKPVLLYLTQCISGNCCCLYFYVLYSVFLNSGDLSRIPEILTNSVIDGAGVDSDIAEDDDEMSSPVKKAKHWRNPSY